MWEKFKSLNVFLKILIVIIAIGMLPATLFFLSIVLFVTLFKKKKKDCMHNVSYFSCFNI
ncbi:Uncharacterised protein [Clostridioides difficile]|nr:Uncharacterised protein [Clostridioides difficile]